MPAFKDTGIHKLTNPNQVIKNQIYYTSNIRRLFSFYC